MERIDTLGHIRRNGSMYFDDAHPAADRLALRLMDDLIVRSRCASDSASGLTSQSTISIFRHGNSWAVAADFDWLNSTDEEVRDVFTHMRPFRELGGNEVRSEPMLAAFADDLAVLSRSRTLLIQGNLLPLEGVITLLNSTSGWTRAVALHANAP